MSYEEIPVETDPIERAELEIEARLRGMTINEVATERFAATLEAELARAGKVLFGLERPSKGQRRH